ncbi:activator of HSP90 ATPase [Sphingomonas metalli]|uniref:Activator of HSP90 ATPase n=1 Tax=Sphingomonas metalli TaxID=1779358 RepID=A0A916WS87_9SPHN|nr:SRPBCC family protein [Sphingomonas metalli]GGB27895.1 activator of HSP90 ATPase [Sphingomonas metalli]
MSGTAAHELSVTRLIDAPVAAVWRAWTEHLGEWFCPVPWRAEVSVMELHPGGRSAMTMYGPNGESMPLEGVYLEVVPQRRIVSTDAFTAGWMPAGPMMVRIDEFAEEDGRTRYTATARHWTAEAKAQHEAMGFEAGWTTSAAQLASVAERLAKSD